MIKYHVLLRFACALLGLLFYATSPLWFGGSNFPAVPLLEGLWVAAVVQRYISLAVIACLVMLILFAQRDHLRIAGALILVGLIAGLVLLNQHRLQPWLIHLTLLIMILSTGNGKAKTTPYATIRWMTVGIYFHSAVSKIDYDFLTGGGFYLVKALGTVFRQSPDTWPEWLQCVSIAALPVFELVVALLLISRAKRSGWVLAMVMHGGLLVALLQLNHKPAVLLWNVGFILQAVYFLSTSDARYKLSSHTDTTSRIVHWMAVSVVCFLPFLNFESIHIWDNWPSWALYSTRSERISVFVLEEAKHQLPPSLQQSVGPPSPILCRVKVDRWSLEETGAPVYPEDRFWVAVALQLSAEVPRTGNMSAEPVHVQIESTANRYSGKRIVKRLAGQKELTEYAGQFTLNAFPVGLRDGQGFDSNRSQPR